MLYFKPDGKEDMWILLKQMKILVVFYIKIKNKMKKFEDYIKAVRRGSREAELEINKGFKVVHRPHTSKKNYNRKFKHKESNENY